MKHRVLVIGVGSIGERHLRCFQATGRAEVSLVEVNESLRGTIAERYKVANAYAGLDTAPPDAGGVAVVCTPAHLHIPMAQKLAERGTHVLIEKPLSITSNGVDHLIRTVAEKRVTAGIAYVYRANPVLADMRRATLDGRFGRPVEFIFVGGQHFPTFRPAYRQIYYTRHETGGGAIQDALTHIFNAAEWLIGPTDRIVCDAAHQVLEGVTVEDTVHAVTRHGSVMGSFALNQHQAPNDISITVVCERGTARYVLAESRWKWMTDPKPGTPWTEEPVVPMERDTWFINQANAFLDAVEGKAPVLCPLAEGLQTLRVNLAALESARTSAWVRIAR
ncbi:MAG: Gfo/Idh/MocA family oxidoreductase [Planctomycetes bacterium]|nr:Gfo/Idh/MocA family oxidoreductase [Planctomycetota bacterium]